MSNTAQWGGYRPNSGRPPLPESEKRKTYTKRLTVQLLSVADLLIAMDKDGVPHQEMIAVLKDLYANYQQLEAVNKK